MRNNLNKFFGVWLCVVMIATGFFVIVNFDSDNVGAENTDSGTWVTKAPMPTARFYTSAVTYDEKIYVIGGCTDESGSDVSLSTVEVYNPLTDSWQTKTPLPTPKEYTGAVKIGDYIYVVGEDDITYQYNPLTDAWNVKAPIPISSLRDIAVSVYDEKMYVCGGYGDPWLYCYDPVTNMWTQKATLTVTYDRDVEGFALLNDKLYLVGGNEEGHSPSEIWRVDVYDPSTDTWQIGGIADLPEGRTHLGPTLPVVNNKIYVIGGWNGYSAQTTVYVYDPATNSWSSDSPMPTARWEPTFAVVDNKIYVIGGNWGGYGGHPQSVNEEYTLSTINQQPLCTITTPSSGMQMSGTFTISGTATDPDGDYQLVKVEVRIDSNSWQTATGTTSWSYNWDTTAISNGQHTIYARAYDGSLHSQIVSVSVTVNNIGIGFDPTKDGFSFLNSFPPFALSQCAFFSLEEVIQILQNDPQWIPLLIKYPYLALLVYTYVYFAHMGGHCYGMSALATYYHSGQESIPDGKQVSELSLDYANVYEKICYYQSRTLLNFNTFIKSMLLSFGSLSNQEEWNSIKSTLDEHRLVVLGMWGKTSSLEPGYKHAVVAYGYNVDANGVIKISVYDPNYGNVATQKATLTPQDDDWRFEYWSSGAQYVKFCNLLSGDTSTSNTFGSYLENSLWVIAMCPVALQIYDSKGTTDFPKILLNDSQTHIAFIPSPQDEKYKIELIGVGNGSYTLSVIRYKDGKVLEKNATGLISKGHEVVYTISIPEDSLSLEKPSEDGGSPLLLITLVMGVVVVAIIAAAMIRKKRMKRGGQYERRKDI